MAFINNESNVLITGGAGFIGSNFILYLLSSEGFQGTIVNVDKLSYAANLDNLEDISDHPRYVFYKEDIQNKAQVEKICNDHKIDLIVHFAAETHVDNSIKDPTSFVMSNVIGTLSLLEIVKAHPNIHFHHISTDEVFGELGSEGAFSEESPYSPNSPYAASKASSDHLVRSYIKTYKISATISNCCNNYGPRQHKEKLIPKIIENLVDGVHLPIYGVGENSREWIFVDDHSRALLTILRYGKRGESYNVGSGVEMSNLELVQKIIEKYCSVTNKNGVECIDLIRFVPDRPGHDFRYFLDCAKIKALGFSTKYFLEGALETTIKFILNKKCLVNFKA